MELQPQYQPGRACGECSVCCRELVIDDPALTKLPGVTCPKFQGGVEGCTIYDGRPHSCREFHCGWWWFPLGPEWRPDKCRIVIVPQAAEPEIGVVAGIKFFFFAELDAVYWPPFINLVWELASKGAPLYVSVPGAAGIATRAALLNSQAHFRDALQRRDFGMTASTISWIIQTCITGPQAPVPFNNPRTDTVS